MSKDSSLWNSYVATHTYKFNSSALYQYFSGKAFLKVALCYCNTVSQYSLQALRLPTVRSTLSC